MLHPAYLLLLISLVGTATACDTLSTKDACYNLISPSIRNPANLTISAKRTSQTLYLLSTVTFDCRGAVMRLVCLDTYPHCDNSTDLVIPTCNTTCTSVLTSCDASDRATLETIFSPTWLEDLCSGLPSTNCYEEQFTTSRSAPSCVTFKSEYCPEVDYPVYIRPGFTLSTVETLMGLNVGYLNFESAECQKAAYKLLCSSFYLRCSNDSLDEMYNYTFPRPYVTPILPCRDVCNTFMRDCAPLYGQFAFLRLDCEASGCDWGKKLNFLFSGNLCPQDPNLLLPDFLLENDSYTFEPMDVPTTHDLECASLEGYSLDPNCTYPVVLPDDPNFHGVIEDHISGSRCEMPCPPLFLYSDSEWRTVENWMKLCIPSFLLTSFLLVTWILFPAKRKQQYVMMFILCNWSIAFAFVFGYAAARNGDMRNLGCVDNSKPHTLGDGSYCAFQSFVLFYFSLAQSCWWLIIAFDLFLGVVLNSRPTPQQLKHRRIGYHVCAWGFSLLLFIVFVSAGGVLGSSQASVLLFCWIAKQPSPDEWLEYLTWISPIGMIWILGCFFMLSVIYKFQQSAMQASQTAGGVSKGLWKKHVRPLAFVITFLFVNLWFFIFRVYQTKNFHALFESTVDFVGCSVALNSQSIYDPREVCGEYPKNRFNTLLLNGIHFAWASQGIFLGLVWGSQAEIFRLWKKFFTTLRTGGTFATALSEASSRTPGSGNKTPRASTHNSSRSERPQLHREISSGEPVDGPELARQESAPDVEMTDMRPASQEKNENREEIQSA